MSGRTWLYADPHFYHEGVCRFTRKDGTKLRPWDNSDEMSEYMIQAYNSDVDDGDRVYILGDVAMNRKALDRSLPRLKGRKVLVKGNHDIDKLSYYSQYFDDIRAYVPKKGFVLSHVPIHPSSLGRWGLNIHGHLHSNTVKNIVNVKGDYIEINTDDPRYCCVSVEHTDYRPVLLDYILKENGVKP